MTRGEALEKLLALGALTLQQLREITGWSELDLWRALDEGTGPSGRLRRDTMEHTWLYSLRAPGQPGCSSAHGPRPPWTPERMQQHVQRNRDRHRRRSDDLRGLRAGEQRTGASAGVGPLQPGVPDVRREDDLRDPPHENFAGEAAQRAHVEGRSRLGCMGPQRAGAAHSGLALMERLGGVGK